MAGTVGWNPQCPNSPCLVPHGPSAGSPPFPQPVLELPGIGHPVLVAPSGLGPGPLNTLLVAAYVFIGSYIENIVFITPPELKCTLSHLWMIKVNGRTCTSVVYCDMRLAWWCDECDVSVQHVVVHIDILKIACRPAIGEHLGVGKRRGPIHTCSSKHGCLGQCLHEREASRVALESLHQHEHRKVA